MVYQEGLIKVSNDIKLLENANDTLKKANELISSNIVEVKHIKFNQNAPSIKSSPKRDIKKFSLKSASYNS